MSEPFVVQSAAEKLLLAISHDLAVFGHLPPADAQMPDYNAVEGVIQIPEHMPRPPWEWLLLSLEAAADLLDLLRASSPWTIQGLVRSILDSINPADAAAADAVRRTRKRLGAKWTPLLGMECPQAAALFRGLASRLREEQRRNAAEKTNMLKLLREAQEKAAEAEESRKRGEAAGERRQPAAFVWYGRTYHFPYRQSLLINALCRRCDTANMQTFGAEGGFEEVADDDVIRAVWPGAPEGEMARYRNNLHQLQNNTNAALEQRKLPLRIERPASNFLRLGAYLSPKK